LFAPDNLCFRFRIPWYQRAVGAGGWLGIPENVNPVVDLFFEFVFVLP
jgi:hypothetical protein